MISVRGQKSVVIAGLGARCAVGLSAPAAAAAVHGGISQIAEHPYMLDKVGEPMMVAREPTIDPMLQTARRFAALCEPALLEALRPIEALGVTLPTIDVMVGLPEPRPGLPTGIEAELNTLITQLIQWPRVRVSFFLNGSAAGFLAMDRAGRALLEDKTSVCLVGGVDSYLTAETLEWMDDERILKSSANRNGFPPGEAAGFCLLTTLATANGVGLELLSQLESVALAREESPIRTQTICVGRGLSEAIQRATASLRLPDERVDDSICDLNGEPYRSEEFALTVLRTQLSFVDATRFTTPADCWGDIGAASAPLFASLAVAAGLRGYAKGPRTLIWAGSEKGGRGAAIVRTAQGAGGRIA